MSTIENTNHIPGKQIGRHTGWFGWACAAAAACCCASALLAAAALLTGFENK